MIGITMGDPRGIGPEIVAKTWAALNNDEREHILIYGDLTALGQAAKLAKINFEQKRLVITSSTEPPVQTIEDSEAARSAISAIDAAVTDVKDGKIGAIVTAPVNKVRMRSIKPNFIGHTEYIAKLAKIKDQVMMFVPALSPNPDDKIAKAKQACFSLVTTHLPLGKVKEAITTEKVLIAIRQTHDALHRLFAKQEARIAVMSLNPHAGEKGMLGDEEELAITPAINMAIKEGINCIGPIAADALFRNPQDFDYDAVVAMYHDQGLIPAKLLCEGNCVNITLGLPFIRTSPGHGTAEDIAWLGNADETGMLAAVRLTRRLIEEIPPSPLL